jgi:HAD superfamily hydrolase (TIGR01509 family)
MVLTESARDRGRAVALDLDGVLIDGMQFHIAAWLDAFSGIGVEVEPEIFYRLEGISTRDVVDLLCKERGLDLDEGTRAVVTAAKRDRYRELFRVVELPGAHDLVETAANLGYGLALVTGTTRESGERALTAMEVRDRFAVVVSGDDVEHGKPAPDPYLHAWRSLQVSAGHCLVIENAPPGVAAAKAAGLPCLGVATYVPPGSLDRADLVVPDVAAARRWLVDEAETSHCSGSFTFQAVSS